MLSLLRIIGLFVASYLPTLLLIGLYQHFSGLYALNETYLLATRTLPPIAGFIATLLFFPKVTPKKISSRAEGVPKHVKPTRLIALTAFVTSIAWYQWDSFNLAMSVGSILGSFLELSFMIFDDKDEYIYEPEPEPVAPEPAYKYPPMPNFDKLAVTTHGSAQWNNPRLLIDRFSDGDDHIDNEGFYVGAFFKVKAQMHGICIAGSGQGKGVCIILPNLLCRPTNSWFVLDPKGENALITARWQKEAGQKVILLDPWGEQKRLGATHRIEPSGFNPLSFIKGNPDEMPESCSVIAQMLIPDSANSKDQYWNSRARSLIKTYLLHLITDRPVSEHHLGTLYRWLRLPVRDRQKLWFEMEENLACDELVKSGIGEFVGLSTDTGPLPSIISTAQDNTTFLESIALRASLEKNDFDPYELTNGRTTVYLCLPERFIDTHARWLRLVVGVCLKACNYRPNRRVNFLLDEFAILGKMPDIQRAYAFARGQKINIYTFFQSLTQLIEIYGENGANTFLANSRLRQFFGIYDLPTQKYLSEYLGDTTVRSLSYSMSSSGNSSSAWAAGSNSTSHGTGYSDGVNISYIGRRLLTAEEVGKSNRGSRYKWTKNSGLKLFIALSQIIMQSIVHK
ncbi:MAG: hypothetical protein BGO21_08645 [Dyadobacter sp. 50-39]|uniref:type IV secretory system conjugative DNA transfer family protein n=1 Tax=Dyadobacter sp. 50-39 TaxID=1895756 RepID=UPI0009692065|nr:type IV secretory system conjugative DNA transfer family protein [Dyadobacter sp. 50-39]OJV19315.1 MAG: hypothetical protein BGO21_08645 [Dyadobacter sp. 50-39]